jgi:hypothetical protein
VQCMTRKRTDKTASEQDQGLDEALEETFPASDPISMQQILVVGRAQRPTIAVVQRPKTGKES